jgi:hypothetical protein
MFPGINKKEQDRVRARFSMDVTKRCSAEIKQAHKQIAGHMTKIIRKQRYTKHHSFACVHHCESGLEMFSAKFQTLGLS